MSTPFERPMVIEMIRSSVQQDNQRRAKAGVPKQAALTSDEYGAGLFTVQPANHWLQQQQQTPAPKKLFGNFWHQGELCILFADTNMGKSILAVQLGNSISRQQPIGPFEVETEPTNVLYIDFELTAKQFEQRYSDPNGPYEFAPGFFRAEFNEFATLHIDYTNFDEYVSAALEHSVKQTGAGVLIVDNITCLRRGTERADQALSLMQHLKAIKNRHNLSLLVLAHTPKSNPAQAITRNHLQGSKMLINFADSAFAIGESHTMPGYRYLKQVKQRSGAETYGSANVCLCRLIRDNRFLQLLFAGNANEYDHLHRPGRPERQRQAQQVAQLLAEGHSQRQVAAKLQVSVGMVNKLANWATAE